MRRSLDLLLAALLRSSTWWLDGHPFLSGLFWTLVSILAVLALALMGGGGP